MRLIPQELMGNAKYDRSTDTLFVEDHIQTHIRQQANVSANVATLTIAPPRLGAYWLLDRMAATCDAGATAILSLYLGDSAQAINYIASSGLAQAGVGLVTIDPNSPIEIPPGENMFAVVTGLGAIATVSFNYWYRLRHFVSSPEEVQAYYEWLTPPIQGPQGVETDKDSDGRQLTDSAQPVEPAGNPDEVPPSPYEATGDKSLPPLFTNDGMADDPTML